MQENISLPIPDSAKFLHPGDRVRLGRFSKEIWIVGYGWFAFGGNRPWCGWYLVSAGEATKIKPLLRPDLDDIYMVEYE